MNPPVLVGPPPDGTLQKGRIPLRKSRELRSLRAILTRIEHAFNPQVKAEQASPPRGGTDQHRSL